MTEDLKICPKCGARMKYTGKTVIGPDRAPYEDGSVRWLECENDDCKHKIVDVGIPQDVQSGDNSALEP